MSVFPGTGHPALPSVVRIDSAVETDQVTDLGRNGWSRLRHRLVVARAVFDTGRPGLVATWHVVAQYWSPWEYHGDHEAAVTGSLRLRAAGVPGWIGVQDFAFGTGMLGHGLVRAEFPDLAPGDYRVELGAETEKDLGAMHGHVRDDHDLSASLWSLIRPRPTGLDVRL
ncbi:hypothetical protein ACIRBX_03480 [Kitasatospora sp. NPDC096147]|uniref:hypothetical protein n=1 Tax=Kitasatospora sp. NPDC096147 TaxID=3364093 RepID=UPI00382FEB38